MPDKPNCYECDHRGGVAGDAHSCCKHPHVNGEGSDVVEVLLALLGKNPLNIKASAHGIKMGWFMHPVNFDPVWLESCDGFTPKGGDNA